MTHIAQDLFREAIRAAFAVPLSNGVSVNFKEEDYTSRVSANDLNFNIELLETDCCGDQCIRVVASRGDMDENGLRCGESVTIVSQKTISELSDILSNILSIIISRMKIQFETEMHNQGKSSTFDDLGLAGQPDEITQYLSRAMNVSPLNAIEVQELAINKLKKNKK